MGELPDPPLIVLRKLIAHASGPKRTKRLETLLRGAEGGVQNTPWFFYVPNAFNDALDIRRTPKVGSADLVWTQGANFSFGAGDMFYDSPNAYGCTWGEALRRMSWCLQIKQANAVTPGMSGNERVAGSVACDLFMPSDDRTSVTLYRSYSMTQDDFVRALIFGPSFEPPHVGSTPTESSRA
jgi:hypothetical protein